MLLIINGIAVSIVVFDKQRCAVDYANIFKSMLFLVIGITIDFLFFRV